jgi:hypothetical protein
MQIDIVKILRIVAGIVICLLWLCLLNGCKTCECLPSVEYRDSIVTRYHHDTIQTYEKDSIYIHAKGDTVWRERWSIRWRDKIVERHDTIYQDRQTETVRVEKVVPTYYKGVSLAFWILVVLLLLATAIRILIRVYLKK